MSDETNIISELYIYMHEHKKTKHTILIFYSYWKHTWPRMRASSSTWCSNSSEDRAVSKLNKKPGASQYGLLFVSCIDRNVLDNFVMKYKSYYIDISFCVDSCTSSKLSMALDEPMKDTSLLSNSRYAPWKTSLDLQLLLSSIPHCFIFSLIKANIYHYPERFVCAQYFPWINWKGSINNLRREEFR